MSKIHEYTRCSVPRQDCLDNRAVAAAPHEPMDSMGTHLLVDIRRSESDLPARIWGEDWEDTRAFQWKNAEECDVGCVVRWNGAICRQIAPIC